MTSSGWIQPRRWAIEGHAARARTNRRGRRDYRSRSGAGWPMEWHAPPRDPPDHVEPELACAQGGHHQPPPLIRRVGLVVAPAAERDQQTQVEVGGAL